ncbi:hypothetical protein ACM39_06510 [Chryseobacterium sp. FH2]|uniref:hypothetical protein n=1 Tax=Chryseobacterium sp. FH2 TaxID=1674291 RepID=UPI00065ABADD|nr:hypothetical protein [Chryseobacterium sp. FH2]KMQ68930.1 hypothetical protein ACM39_06510 [Chryseobacterium sp. FH2]
MKKQVIKIICILLSPVTFAQVGINETNPSATLDIKSKGNTGATKALEINNSTGTEMLTVLDNGNVGINVTAPTAKLHTNGSIRYENLPQFTGSVSPLAIDANGYVGTYVPSVAYSYITIDTSETVNNFSLNNNSIFYSIPFASTGIVNNPLGVSRGLDASATLTRTSGTTVSTSQVVYITIPNPGIYKLNLNYYTSCTGTKSSSSGGNNLLGIGTGIYLASAGSTNYQELTTIRYNAFPLRQDTGILATTGTYNYPFAHNIFSVVETASANQKIAFFVNWGTGDQFNTNVCSLSAPSGLDKRVTLIISKL